MDLSQLFSWSFQGLGRVLLISAWPARVLLPTLQVSLAQCAAGCPCCHKCSFWLWWPWLPGVLKVFPQPGGQCLAHLIQQLGKLHVVVPVIILQEGAGIRVHLWVFPALAFA